MSQSRSAVSAHKIGWHKDHHHVFRKEKGSKRTCAKRQVRQFKALITRACLKHSDVPKLDNWIETSPTAVHILRDSQKKKNHPFLLGGHISLNLMALRCPTCRSAMDIW